MGEGGERETGGFLFYGHCLIVVLCSLGQQVGKAGFYSGAHGRCF